jgi:uncharacterized protein involved in exopolysaccharide biosynthesis
VTAGRIDEYLRQLERELDQRGRKDVQIIEEAREHLVDAVEDGLRRGLSLDDAEREAFERFGAPQMVAAHIVPERSYIMNRVTAVVDNVWQRKWWILAPTVLTAVLTSVASYYFFPTRYQSESVIRIVPRVTTANIRLVAGDRSPAQFYQLNQTALSRTRLEKLISDFGLYQTERERAPLSDVVSQMRRDITVRILSSNDAQDDHVGMFTVSFISADPTMAMKITDRLAGLIIDQNLHETERQAVGTAQLIDSQIDDVRGRIIAHENTLENLRAQNRGRAVSRADVLPYEVLQEKYKALLIEREELRLASLMERRQIGESFQLIDPARLPEQPVGPSRVGVNIAGAFAGLGLGLLLVSVRGKSNTTRA